jgi:hypothetical protein
MIDAALHTNAATAIAAMPVGLEMPAGSGKTQLVAAIVGVAAERQSRTLVLTHTHAGVDAIRNRLRSFGVSRTSAHIDTITGWAFDLVRSYPVIAGFRVPPEPDWRQSRKYLQAAIRVVRSRAIAGVHQVSFDYFVVDEYQDCNTIQHEFVLAVSNAIPKTCVLGDRLQGIFDFGGEALVDWDEHVFSRFPLLHQDHIPHRWRGHNEPLGQWLLDIRPTLLQRRSIDLSSVSIEGFTWDKTNRASVVAAAQRPWPTSESVLVLGQWPSDANDLARDLNGRYGVMEDIQGNFMIEFLGELEQAELSEYGSVLARFAKRCFSGLAGIDSAVTTKLAMHQPSAQLSRPGLESILLALDSLNFDPSLQGVAAAMKAIGEAPSIRLYKTEAWTDVLKAIESAVANQLTTVSALARIRDSLRHSGRRPIRRAVSRTVLVKGLEFDHVVIGDASALRSHRNLYVALTRARKSISVFSQFPTVNY